MSRFLSKLGDDGHDNNLSAALLRAPNGALTHWRTAHPNGDSAVWREDHPQGVELLRRFRGGPFIVNQENYLGDYTLLQPVYRCEYEGFTGVAYQVTYRLPQTGGDAVRGFTAFSIDTPASLPRTAVRPTTSTGPSTSSARTRNSRKACFTRTSSSICSTAGWPGSRRSSSTATR